MDPVTAGAIMFLMSCHPDAPNECVRLPMEQRRFATITQCQDSLPAEIDRLQSNDNLIRGRCAIEAPPAAASVPTERQDVPDPISTASISAVAAEDGREAVTVRVTRHSDGPPITEEYQVLRAE